jgi:hypothetical protein
MSIIVKKLPDVHVTEAELRRYRSEWKAFCMHYCGEPPSLEEYIRSQKLAEQNAP